MKIHQITLIVALSIITSLAVASTTNIGDRQDIMKSNASATKPVVAMLKGEMPFDLIIVQKSLAELPRQYW
jgi:cytochrome c556